MHQARYIGEFTASKEFCSYFWDIEESFPVLPGDITLETDVTAIEK